MGALTEEERMVGWSLAFAGYAVLVFRWGFGC